ncbi:patched domain-containing protein 3 [Elgaria multicarinata webbii]|uniref:patched domain-containing protein 3 n=1 Tax=Elgaria multicarinata webbii TaxID=159646 RepID=UPI002FCCDA16
MPGCSWHTDCVERPLSRALRALGASVGAHPWPFLLLPLALSGALGAGFMFLPSREANDIEVQFTPLGGPAKRERSFVQTHFPTDDAERFSMERLSTEGAFASFIAVASGDSGSVLTRAAFAELLALDAAVRGLNATPPNGTELTYDRLCARNSGNCSSPNPLLSAVKGDPAQIEALLPTVTFPEFQDHQFLGFFLGGVTLGPGAGPKRPVRAAKALRLIYFLQEDEAAQREASALWLHAFLERIPGVLESLNLTSVRVAYFTSVSRQEEFEKNAKGVIPLFSITYFLTIFFSITSCSRFDCVRTKLWIATFGVLSSGLSVLSSFGLLLFCGVPFVITVTNAPFLILGVGVDDMFIMVSCWQHTKVKDRVKDRMADTYAEAAVSVTITTLTDVLAFYIGIATSFPSVQSFCIYTGTAFVFCYIYNLTFFGAVLALNGRREESNRHWLTFMKVKNEPQDPQDHMYNMCCVGGSYDESTGAETEHPMNGFFRKYYGPFLMHSWTKLIVVVLYLTYLGSSIYGCIQLKQGIDLRNLATDNSYVIQYYVWEREYFSEYGPRVMVVVTEPVAYWNSSVRAELENCMESLENSSYVDKNHSDSWLRVYQKLSKDLFLNIDNHKDFIDNLRILFTVNPASKWDINISAMEILASRFFIQTVNVTSAVDEGILLNQLRGLAENCKIPLIVYHPGFIYFDQYLVITQNTIQNVVIASGAMLVISLLLIPNLLCSLWVTFAIASVIVGVTGFMTYWDINLDSISMINLVICIGFSVDFSAHISYAFVSSKKPKVNEKAVDALYHLGYPVLQGAVSTILGVAVLSVAASYIFRTFFKIMFLVIMFGAAHGLIFIPVFLTFFGFCGRQAITQDQMNGQCYENSIVVEGNIIKLPPFIAEAEQMQLQSQRQQHGPLVVVVACYSPPRNGATIPRGRAERGEKSSPASLLLQWRPQLVSLYSCRFGLRQLRGDTCRIAGSLSLRFNAEVGESCVLGLGVKTNGTGRQAGQQRELSASVLPLRSALKQMGMHVLCIPISLYSARIPICFDAEAGESSPASASK